MTISQLTSLIPAELDIVSMVKFIAMFALGVLILGGLGRMIFGKRSSLNHAVSSAIGIFFIYVVTVVIYTFNPYELTRFLTPLPFVSFSHGNMHLSSFAAMEFHTICTEVLSMVILAFLVNLLDTWMPKGKKIFSWYLWRFLTVVVAMLLHYCVRRAFNSFLPGVLVTYAPMILLGILIFMLLIGVLKVILSLVLTVVNPIIGGIYTFFFSNKIGKQLSKAVLTTLILCIVVYLLTYFGYSVISIQIGTIGTYVPLIAVLLILWYSIGHI